MEYEHQLREKSAAECKKAGNTAKCPFGSGMEYIWDWQQDCYINVSFPEGRPVMSTSILLSNIDEYKIYVCENTEGEEYHTNALDSETYVDAFYDGNGYLGFTIDGLVYVHPAWVGIDWEKCGF